MDLKITLPNGSIAVVPITSKTLVGHVIHKACAQMGEAPNAANCSLRSCGFEIPRDLRACALPTHTQLTLDMQGTYVSQLIVTPRVMPTRDTIPIFVQFEDAPPQRIRIFPDDAVSTLRRQCWRGPPFDGYDSTNYRVFCDGRIIVDESHSFRELGISEANVVSFQTPKAVEEAHQGECEAAAIRSVYHNSFTRREISSIQKAAHSFHVCGPRPPSCVQILFSDPEDENFTYEVFARGDKPVSTLLEFVSHRQYQIWCDGSICDDDSTFAAVTRNDDGCIFTLISKV